MSIKKLGLKLGLKWIENADSLVLNDVLAAVHKRYGYLFPDWEMIFMSLPKMATEERNMELDKMIAVIKKYSKA